MEQNEKNLLRAVMRLVHPDLYSAYPVERETNAESLKLLNGYLDDLANGVRPQSVCLKFWIKSEESLIQVEAVVKENGNLSSLYHALGLITAAEYSALSEGSLTERMDEDLVVWLRKFISQVVQDGEQHALLQNTVNVVRAEIEEAYSLRNVVMGSEFGIRVSDLELQLRLLRGVAKAFQQLENKALFNGLSLCIHHPDCLPLDPFSNGLFSEESEPSMESSLCWISEEGSIHLLIKCEEVSKALEEVDLDRCRLLTQLHLFWEQRAADLQTLMQALFQVEEVLCDTSTGANVQQFVLWAGCIMAHRDRIRERLAGRVLPLVLLIHSDMTAPMIDYSTASSTLHVRTDCTPLCLLNFVVSERCLNAGDEAKEMISDDVEEERILEEARKALGAKHVIRICSIYERQKAIKAAERLIKNADLIRQSIDLSEAGIAIDTNYQAWESGFISIPYDYQLTELKPNLQKLIGSGKQSTSQEAPSQPFQSLYSRKRRPKTRRSPVGSIKIQTSSRLPHLGMMLASTRPSPSIQRRRWRRCSVVGTQMVWCCKFV